VAALIDAGTGNNVWNPQVAMDASGNAIAVFQDDGGNDRVYANRWNGSTWGGAAQIDAGGGNDAGAPQIAMDGSGNAVAVFSQSDGVNSRVYANRWNGSTWSGAALIDAGGGNSAHGPRVAMDGSGNAVAVFLQWNGTGLRVYANRWNGSTWSGATLIDAGGGNDAYDPRVAMDGSGNAVAVFRLYTGINYRVYANRWNGSTWSVATLIDASPGDPHDDARGQQVAMDGSGNAVAVFMQWDTMWGIWHVYANRWNGSTWSGAALIDAGGGNSAHDPQVAMDGSGNAVAVFSQYDGGNDRVRANRWNGSTWSGAAQIDAGGGNGADAPQVAMDGSGNAVAVFSQSDGVNSRVYANRWNGPIRINYQPAASQTPPGYFIDSGDPYGTPPGWGWL
jgi:hypothetical protein